MNSGFNPENNSFYWKRIQKMYFVFNKCLCIRVNIIFTLIGIEKVCLFKLFSIIHIIHHPKIKERKFFFSIIVFFLVFQAFLKTFPTFFRLFIVNNFSLQVLKFSITKKLKSFSINPIFFHLISKESIYSQVNWDKISLFSSVLSKMGIYFSSLSLRMLKNTKYRLSVIIIFFLHFYQIVMFRILDLVFESISLYFWLCHFILLKTFSNSFWE